MASVYGIVDLCTSQLVYVGVTKHSPQDRLKKHLYDAARDRSQSRFHRWLKNRQPEDVDVFEIELVVDGDWQEAETFWIAYFKSIGANLKNILSGGDGLIGLVRSPEHCARIGDALRGRPKTPEHIAAWRAAMKHKSPSAETRQKLSAAIKGRPRAPEHVAATAAGNRGKKRSAEHCRRMSEILTSPEVRAKLTRPRGPMPEHVKAKISATKLAKRHP